MYNWEKEKARTLSNFALKSTKEVSQELLERVCDYLDDIYHNEDDSVEATKLNIILRQNTDFSQFISVVDLESFMTRNCDELDLSEIFFDESGSEYPMTFEEVCDGVRENPMTSTQEGADAEYFLSADKTLSYSIQEIANIIGVELEILEEEY